MKDERFVVIFPNGVTVWIGIDRRHTDLGPPSLMDGPYSHCCFS
jgi:hypothetical protein